jgi:hypothetical protein
MEPSHRAPGTAERAIQAGGLLPRPHARVRRNDKRSYTVARRVGLALDQGAMSRAPAPTDSTQNGAAILV